MNDHHIPWSTLQSLVQQHKDNWHRTRSLYDQEGERAAMLAFAKELDKWMCDVIRQYDPEAVSIAHNSNFHNLRIAMEE